MIEIHRRTHAEREVIFLNKTGQPEGPDEKVVTKFSRFLGTSAKYPNLAPLNYVSWKYVPAQNKTSIWDYVKERYMIDEKGKKMGDLWRVYKSRLKEKHFTPYDTNEERLDHKPENIPINQFEGLIDYWSSEKAKETSKSNKKSRDFQDDVHTIGPSSFALLRTQLQKKDPNNQPPSEAKVYKESRKRVEGRTYKTNNEKSKKNIEEMDTLQSAYIKDGDGSSSSKDPYGEVMKTGRLHLCGRSVTKSKLKEVAKDQGPSCILPSEYLESIKKELVQQIAPELISILISKIKDANTGVELNIPDFDLSSRDATTSIPSTPNEQPQDSEHRQDERRKGSDD